MNGLHFHSHRLKSIVLISLKYWKYVDNLNRLYIVHLYSLNERGKKTNIYTLSVQHK
jgi:hypothetical protein